ncbi:methyl-accepting chemotaxis protein [Marinospirillum insulare]|uniref:Methyl-accepting chemotaxis protein n=1 Tax=Marinospirillum insulare TaxID=217169 RepID=A0ABQ6A1A9_9GAMM|nr:methyl-accepting chemotaxis protein [Marinospirillum insulare]GLR65188.1 hypothetical protein GCM10007878_26270 [Marinospirillum insulare]
MTLLTLFIQTSLYTKSRVESLMQQELPTNLAYLGAEVALELAPSIHLSRSLANNPLIERWVKEGSPDAELTAVSDEMAKTFQDLSFASVFFVVNDGEEIDYYYFSNTLKTAKLVESNFDDAWYFEYLNSMKPYELNLDSNEFTGDSLQMFVNYSGSKINHLGQPMIIGGVGLDMQKLADLISNYRLGEQGRASLANHQGLVEVNSNNSIITDLTTTPELESLLGHKGQVVKQVTYQGQELFLGVVWLEDLQRYLVVEVPLSEFMTPIKQQFYKSLFLGGLFLLASLILLYPLAVSLSRPLVKFQQQLSDITLSLDLSKRLETSDQAELGDLASQINSLLKRIEQAISGVLVSSEELTSTATHLAQTAGLVGRNTDKQQEVSQTMAAAVEQMSSSVAEITSTMEELSASSTQIADHSQSVVEVANLTLDSSKKGADAMQNLQERMGDIHQDSANSLQEIIQLGSKSKEISKVMDLINTLADQTKLIAFNAALEASSAGESGKRFSVVASEIRRLADSVTDSTHEIEDRIQEIQDSISRLVITSEKGADSIQLGMQVSSETAEDLNALVQAASKTSNAAQQISLSTKQQKTASGQVVVALHDIASASSHNAESVRNITDVSESMLKMSQQLTELVHEFKVKR